MRTFIIQPDQAGRRLDKWMQASFPSLPFGKMQSAFRKKDVKVNGHPAKPEQRLMAGDAVAIYLDDDLLIQPKRENKLLAGIRPRLRILYEDERLMLIDKPAGLICHPDAHEKVRTLLTEAQAHLYQKGVWDGSKQSFAPALCNRIDRFTGGIVMMAVTEDALKEIDARIRAREVEKRYICIAAGRPKRPEWTMTNYLLQPDGAKRVQVLDKPAPGAKEARTSCRALMHRDGLTLIECTLHTGRTHQIRAQLAHMGLPLLGDTQYGDRRVNERYRREGQALYAYRLGFRFKSDGPLSDLNGRTWTVGRVPFAEDFFGRGWAEEL